jgi:glycosyltransferase A (GT-A) superfamily protein (DUF2064 family)
VMKRTTGWHVLVMAKEPVPGRAKTRLCPPLTPTEAASVAEAALAGTLAVRTGGCWPLMASPVSGCHRVSP